ncbi:MAG: hypothetical protein KatS3mg108_1836 [Isosphaeraceae bacterium]|jgi:hypothetical protein|nr:MAG: hypothetical protein KatS3mg108_1836 [Isosphaeraceae bacterium]
MYALIVLGDSPSAVALSCAAAAQGQPVALVPRPEWGTSRLINRDLARDVLRDALRGLPGHLLGTPDVALSALKSELARRQQLLASSALAAGVTVVPGLPQRTAFNTVTVDHRPLPAQRIVLALAGLAVPTTQLPHPNLATQFDTETFWHVRSLPRSILVAGSGEAWEYAQILARIGLKVSLITADASPGGDPILKPLVASLLRQGVRVLFGSPDQVERRGDRWIFRSREPAPTTVEAEALLRTQPAASALTALGLDRIATPQLLDPGRSSSRPVALVPGRLWALGPSLGFDLDPEANQLQVSDLLRIWSGQAPAPIPLPWTIGTDPAVVCFSISPDLDSPHHPQLETALAPTTARGVPGLLRVRIDARGRLLAAAVCHRDALRLLPTLARAIRQHWSLERLSRETATETPFHPALAALAHQFQAQRRPRRDLRHWIRHLAGYLETEPTSLHSAIAPVDQAQPARPA